MKNNQAITPEEKLLVEFLKYLWGDGLTNNVEDYNVLVFGYANAVHLRGFTAEKAYLLRYKEKNGTYPDKFQQKMNEWILTERM